MNNFALTETLARMKGGSADVGVANLRPPSSAASGEFFPDMARLLLLHAPKDEFYLTEYIAECRSFMKAYTPYAVARMREEARLEVVRMQRETELRKKKMQTDVDRARVEAGRAGRKRARPSRGAEESDAPAANPNTHSSTNH